MQCPGAGSARAADSTSVFSWCPADPSSAPAAGSDTTYAHVETYFFPVSFIRVQRDKRSRRLQSEVMSEADGKISLHGNRNTRSARPGLAACTTDRTRCTYARTVHAEAQTAPADTRCWRAGQSRPLERCRCGDRHAAVPASAPGRLRAGLLILAATIA